MLYDAHRARPLVDLLEEQRAEARGNWSSIDERGRAANRRIQAEIDAWLAACPDDEGRAAVICLMLGITFAVTTFWHHQDELGIVMPRVRDWTIGELAVLLHRVTEKDLQHVYSDTLCMVLDVVEQLDADSCRALEPWLQHVHRQLMECHGKDLAGRGSAGHRLRTLLARVDEAGIPEGLIPADDRWAAPLRERVASAPSRELADLLRHLPIVPGPRPTRTWRRTCLALADAASARDVLADVLGRLAEERPMWRVTDVVPSMAVGPLQSHLVHPTDGELVRGLIWAAATTGGPAAVPHLDVLTTRFAGLTAEVCGNIRLAGAAVKALADIGGQDALDVLRRQRDRIGNRVLRKQLETALGAVAETPRHGGAVDRTQRP
ncbi:hypothetical protein ABT026_25315 [Streptomyces sp. NPDC002734]|uniref:hypothetical protein n=1 Tax=Streptomyces sp. NPDC002734 TaxID=3154426 RepID=UPI003329FAD9